MLVFLRLGGIPLFVFIVRTRRYFCKVTSLAWKTLTKDFVITNFNILGCGSSKKLPSLLKMENYKIIALRRLNTLSYISIRINGIHDCIFIYLHHQTALPWLFTRPAVLILDVVIPHFSSLWGAIMENSAILVTLPVEGIWNLKHLHRKISYGDENNVKISPGNCGMKKIFSNGCPKRSNHF